MQEIKEKKMTEMEAVDIINKHQACRHSECDLNCEACSANATPEEIDEALRMAREALVLAQVYTKKEQADDSAS